MLSPTATLVLTTVACTMSYAMVFPTLAPLLASLEHINSDDSSRWLGVAVSVFSAVKVFAAPPVGALTQRVGWRPTLVCLILFLIAGNAWYALAPTVASVIVARGLVGISGCSSTVCRTAARHGSSKQDRERDAALLSSASTFGFIAGPGLGGLCSLAPSVPWLRLRAPGCIGCGLGAFTLIAVALTTRRRSDDNPLNDSLDSARDVHVQSVPPQVDVVGAVVGGSPNPAAGMQWRQQEPRRHEPAPRSSAACFALCLVQLAATSPFASIETLVTPYVTRAFHFSTLATGLLFAGGSFTTLLVTAITPCLLRRSSARVLLLVAMIALGGSCFAMAASVDNEYAFVASFVAFFGAFAVQQTALFCTFNEAYHGHASFGAMIGWISSTASIGRCVGPLWALEVYLHNPLAVVIPPGLLPAVNATAVDDGRAMPVWGLNGIGAWLGVCVMLVAWRQLRPLPSSDEE